MKMERFLAALLLMCSVSLGMAMLTAKGEDVNSLDMAPNSVDDMYIDCVPEMEEKVKKTYLPDEKNNSEDFKSAWEEAGKKFGGKKKKPLPFRLALYVYTLEKPNVHYNFNNAVRTQESSYSTTFSNHSLHFYLTRAIQRLNSNTDEHADTNKCLTVYRRTKSYFSQDVENKEFRFGSFTSSSLGNYPDPDKFGKKSCFKIWTCFGADISEYSAVTSEREVLIPPYEVFKVTDIQKQSDHNNLPCEFVYEVKSTHTTQSNLNCDLFKK